MNHKQFEEAKKQDQKSLDQLHTQDQTLDFKLGEVLRETGLISTKHLESMLAKVKDSDETFTDVLKKEVSLTSLKALFTAEIPLPFGSRKKDEIRSVILESGIITDEELSKALEGSGATDEDLGKILLERGMITEKNLKEVKQEMEKTGLPLWRILMTMKLVSHAQIADLMKARMGRGTSIAREEFLIDILLNLSLLKKENLEKARELQKDKGGSLLTHLIESGLISVKEVTQTLENVLDIPFVDLKKKPPDPDMLFVIPEHVIRQKKILPLKVREGKLLLGMLDPLNDEAVQSAQMLTGLSIQPCLIRREDWEKAIQGISNVKPGSGTGSELERVLREGTKSGMISSEDMSAVQMASSIIDGAINARATDIHLEPQLPEMRVRYRIDGMLYDVMSIPTNLELPVMSRIKLLSNMDITEKRRPQDGHFSMKVQGRDFNFRTATIPTYHGEKMTVRFLDESRVLKGLKQLGLAQDELTTLEGLIEKPYGLIIVTGPIGSGKTTTLYAALNQTNILNRNAITIEDPVEYRLAGINQVQVNTDVGLDFKAGLRSILRHDADIIMVGEVRDNETARVATWAALTGQLVFCTLHTNDSAGAVTMMKNLGVESFLLASSVIGVVAQRLVRRLCPECREMIEPDLAIRKKFNLGDDPELRIGKAVGCDACFRTGYQGRTGVYEVLTVDDEIKKLIIDNAPDSEIKQASMKQGMRTIWQNGQDKILEGITTPEEVLREIIL